MSSGFQVCLFNTIQHYSIFNKNITSIFWTILCSFGKAFFYSGMTVPWAQSKVDYCDWMRLALKKLGALTSIPSSTHGMNSNRLGEQNGKRVWPVVCCFRSNMPVAPNSMTIYSFISRYTIIKVVPDLLYGRLSPHSGVLYGTGYDVFEICFN